ncbi:MAG: hypothetical protein HC924_04480, partial [Synechococcaceae cyanobacterium SM2_3_2]|nr:hypothetical protein [Synechococcaceae cyanobacterium SM2_3_2]
FFFFFFFFAEQSTQNAQAGSLRLSPEDIQLMDQISRTVTNTLDDNPVMWTFAAS